MSSILDNMYMLKDTASRISLHQPRRIVGFRIDLRIQMTDGLERLRADYQAAKAAFLAANAALTARLANRTTATAAQIRELRSATSMLNAAGRALSEAEKLAG